MDHPEPLLSHLSPQTPSPDLMGRILLTIQSTRWRRWRRDAALLTIGIVLHSLYTAVTWLTVWLELRETSLFSFLRLAWSDPDVVLTNLREYGTGILESLPIDGLLVVCMSLFLLIGGVGLWRVRRSLQQRQKQLLSS